MTTPLTPEELIERIKWEFPKTLFEVSAVAHAKELIEVRTLAGRMAEIVDDCYPFDDPEYTTIIADCCAAGLLPPKPSAEAGEVEKP